MEKPAKYFSPIDRKYVADSKPFIVQKESFTESDLTGLDDLRRLIYKHHADDEHAGQSDYQRKVNLLLSYKRKETAVQMIEFEVGLLRQIVDDTYDTFSQPPTDEAIDKALMSWFVDSFITRLND